MQRGASPHPVGQFTVEKYTRTVPFEKITGAGFAGIETHLGSAKRMYHSPAQRPEGVDAVST